MPRSFRICFAWVGLLAASLAHGEVQPKEDKVESYRLQQPAPGTPHNFNLPKLDHFKLKNGLEVFLLEEHQLPTVSASLEFVGGSIYDPQDKSGQAGICMSLLTRGTKDKSYLQWKEALRDLAAQIESVADAESQSIYLASLTANFDKTVALLGTALTQAGLNKEEFDRLIKLRLADIKQEKTSPDSIASRVGESVLFGLDHPIGRIATEEALGRLKVEDCVKYLQASVKPGGAKLFVVGDLTRPQVERLFGQIKGWQGAGLAEMKLAQPASKPGNIYFVNVAGAEQSYVGLKDFGPLRVDKDYHANTLMSMIYGGSFNSRINMNLREDKGYSYGARGGLYYQRQFGEFSAGSTVRSDATYQSLLEIYGEMKDLQAGLKPVTAAEWQREQKGAVLSLPGKFGTSEQSLSQFRNLVTFGLPLDYFNSYVSEVSKVDLKQVQSAAQNHLHPDTVKILVVGDGDKKVIFRSGSEDVPLMDGKKQLSLLESLKTLLRDKRLPGKALIVIDADGNEKERFEPGS